MKIENKNNKFRCKVFKRSTCLQNLPKFRIKENLFNLEINSDGPEITFWALWEDLGSLQQIVSRKSVQMPIA